MWLPDSYNSNSLLNVLFVTLLAECLISCSDGSVDWEAESTPNAQNGLVLPPYNSNDIESSQSEVYADIDGSGCVGINDYLYWVKDYGKTDSPADINGNGSVGADDYSIWADNYRGCDFEPLPDFIVPGCTGDLNEDGYINHDDRKVWEAGIFPAGGFSYFANWFETLIYLETVPYYEDYDLDEDGDIDIVDYSKISYNGYCWAL